MSTKPARLRAVLPPVTAAVILLGATSAQSDRQSSSTLPTPQSTLEKPILAPITREQRFLQAVSNNHPRTIDRALELGVSITTRDDLRRGAVLLATMNSGALELVQYLHHRGADIDTRDRGGRSALSFAASQGHSDIASYLIVNGAQLNQTDRRGRSPLLYAAAKGHTELVELLLENGAAINQQDRFGDSALMISCAKGHTQVVSQLLLHQADATLLDQEGRGLTDRAAASCQQQLKSRATSDRMDPPPNNQNDASRRLIRASI